MGNFFEVKISAPLRLHEVFRIGDEDYVIKSIFSRQASETLYDVVCLQGSRSSYWGPFAEGRAILAPGLPRIKQGNYQKMEDLLTIRIKSGASATRGQN